MPWSGIDFSRQPGQDSSWWFTPQHPCSGGIVISLRRRCPSINVRESVINAKNVFHVPTNNKHPSYLFQAFFLVLYNFNQYEQEIYQSTPVMHDQSDEILISSDVISCCDINRFGLSLKKCIFRNLQNHLGIYKKSSSGIVYTQKSGIEMMIVRLRRGKCQSGIEKGRVR